MAGGYFTKTGVSVVPKFLNNVNDAVSGGLGINALPAGMPQTTVSQTLPGDRICLDDATALALSLTTTGTLFGGIYEYVQTLSSSTASPAVGAAAFFRATDIGSSNQATGYQVTADAQPSAAIPGFFQGVFINAITKGNFGWIQIAGLITGLYDAAAPTDATAGRPVFLKISPTTASTFDCGLSTTIATTVTQIAQIVGVSVETPTNAGLKKIALTRAISRI